MTYNNEYHLFMHCRCVRYTYNIFIQYHNNYKVLCVCAHITSFTDAVKLLIVDIINYVCIVIEL